MQPRKFKIFLSSPGDVQAERDIARRVIQGLMTDRESLRGRVVLEIVDWQKLLLGAWVPPQEAINRIDTPAKCDITLVILWGRMGTPVSFEGRQYRSGTEWEFENARAAKPESVFLFHRIQEATPSTMQCKDRWEYPEQLDSRDAFLAEVRANGTVTTYEDEADFEKQLTDKLADYLWRQLQNSQTSAEGPQPLALAETAANFQPAYLFGENAAATGYNRHLHDLERYPHTRKETAARLKGVPWTVTYAGLLDDLLGLAERIWGPRGSGRAIITCVFFSLVYAYVLFWLSVALPWDNPLTDADGFHTISALTQHGWVLFASAVLLPAALTLAGRWLGRVEERLKDWLWRSRLGASRRWSTGYGVASVIATAAAIGILFIIASMHSADARDGTALAAFFALWCATGPILGGAIAGKSKRPWRAMAVAGAGAMVGALVGAVAVNGAINGAEAVAVAGAVVLALAIAGAVAVAGTVAGTVAVAGAGVGAVAVAGAVDLIGSVAGAAAVAGAVAALSVRRGVRTVNLYSAIIGGLAVWAFVGVFLDLNAEFYASFIITMLILPLVNGVLDYLSWRVSRWLGEDLRDGLAGRRSAGGVLSKTVGHLLYDFALALIFFAAMACALGFSFQLYERYGELGIDLRTYAQTMHDAPLKDGLWVTLMLFTTLIPTIVHLGMVIGALLPATMKTTAEQQALALRLDAMDGAATEDCRDDIIAAAKFAHDYHWRMVAGSIFALTAFVLVLWLVASILGEGTLTWLAHQSGLFGIELADRLMGPLPQTSQ